MISIEYFVPGNTDPVHEHHDLTIQFAASYVRDLSTLNRPKAKMTGPTTILFSWPTHDVVVYGCTLVALRAAAATLTGTGELAVSPSSPTPPVWKQRMENLKGSNHSIEDGTYTMVATTGEHTTIRIRSTVIGGENRRIVEYLSGSDNETDFMGFAFLNYGKVSIWKRYLNGTMGPVKTMVEAMIAGGTSEEAGLAYALASGKCRKCNRKLTVPASIHRGYGPECAKKVGK